METQTDHQQPSDDPSPEYPRWVLLEKYNRGEDPDADTVTEALASGGRHDADTVTEALTSGVRHDADTVTKALASGGRHLRVSFGFAAPPAVSRLRVDCPGRLPDGTQLFAQIIAAHRDSVLIKIETSRSGRFDIDEGDSSDYFVYNAGDAAADPSRPPSLSLLPPCHEGERKRKRFFPAETTALLRRGEDDLLVGQLSFYGRAGAPVEVEAELCLLRSGGWEWELKRLPVPILHDDGKRKEVYSWHTGAVIPVGDRFLCWVNYNCGVIFSDVWEVTPQLRYVSLPVEPDLEHRSGYNGSVSSYRRVCTTDGGGAMSFVEVFPRCCCGCPGATFCERSRRAFSITTWTLRMDDMTTWDKVAVMDSDELWPLPGYGGLPRIRPQYPVISLDDPDVLCFMVHKTHMEEDVVGDHGTWLFEVDTMRMELRSIFCYDDYCTSPEYVPCVISQYFSRSRPPPANRHERARTTTARTTIELSLSDSTAMASPGEMLATLREIGDLARDDMMRTYSVLACDGSQFKFRLLLAIPMDMRKDYCLLLIENRL